MTDTVASMISGGQGFFEGAVVLGHALKRYGKGYPKVLLVEQDSYSQAHLDYLGKLGWDLKLVPPLRTLPCKFAASRWPKTFTKLHLWDLTEYSRVLYMDTDACPFAPITPFFGYNPEFVAGTHARKCKRRIRTGLLLLRPDQKIFDDLKELLAADPATNGAKLGDQGVLNVYFKNRFDLFPNYYHVVDWGQHVNRVIVGHLRPKPWVPRKGHPVMRKYVASWRRMRQEAITAHGPLPQ